MCLRDWLPSLNRAAQWNGWESEELLMQLAGYLKGPGEHSRSGISWRRLSKISMTRLSGTYLRQNGHLRAPALLLSEGVCRGVSSRGQDWGE